MTSCPLSSSYPNAFQSRALRDVTKSRLGEDPLSESWPMSFMQSASFKSMKPAPITTPDPSIEDDENRNSTGNNDLSSLAWLQRECLLDIPPLDDIDERPLTQHKDLPFDANKDKNQTTPSPKQPMPQFQSPSPVVELGSVRRPGKPAYSYTHLIFMAIESSPHKCRTVNQIYNWCETHFPYFRSAGPGWKNSLRHNLSINKCFRRIPRDGRGPGRGAYWTVEPGERQQLLVAVKRNPWTYYAGLASIPELQASLPLQHLNQAIPVSLVQGGQHLQHSSSEDPVTSSGAASSLEEEEDGANPRDENGIAKEEREEARESARYASMLRYLTLHQSPSSGAKGGVVSTDRKSENHHHYHHHRRRRRRSRSNSKQATVTAEPASKNESSPSSPHQDLLNGRLNASDLQGVLDLMSFQSRRSHSHPSKNNSPDRSISSSTQVPGTHSHDRRSHKESHSSSNDRRRSSSKCHVCERRKKRRRRRQRDSAAGGDSLHLSSSSGSLRRRNATACFVTPAPSLDHEYAKFQAQLHPPTNFSDDDEVEAGAGEETRTEVDKATDLEEEDDAMSGNNNNEKMVVDDDVEEDTIADDLEIEEVSTESRDSELEEVHKKVVKSSRKRRYRPRQSNKKKLIIRLSQHNRRLKSAGQSSPLKSQRTTSTLASVLSGAKTTRTTNRRFHQRPQRRGMSSLDQVSLQTVTEVAAVQ